MQNPITNVAEFFREIVARDVDEARAEPGNVRYAFHALISLHQLNDWAFNEQPRDYTTKAKYNKALRTFCDNLEDRWPVLKTVREYATNAKHRRPFSAPPSKFGNSAMEATSPLLTAIANAESGIHILLPVILEAYACWQAMLANDQPGENALR